MRLVHNDLDRCVLADRDLVFDNQWRNGTRACVLYGDALHIGGDVLFDSEKAAARVFHPLLLVMIRHADGRVDAEGRGEAFLRAYVLRSGAVESELRTER